MFHVMADTAPEISRYSIWLGFTICLFISPDLDGYRAYIDPARPTKVMRHDMFHDMFVPSPELDGFLSFMAGAHDG